MRSPGVLRCDQPTRAQGPGQGHPAPGMALSLLRKDEVTENYQSGRRMGRGCGLLPGQSTGALDQSRVCHPRPARPPQHQQQSSGPVNEKAVHLCGHLTFLAARLGEYFPSPVAPGPRLCRCPQTGPRACTPAGTQELGPGRSPCLQLRKPGELPPEVHPGARLVACSQPVPGRCSAGPTPISDEQATFKGS